MKRDGRKLDHKTLEAIRLMAMERLGEGEAASAVMKLFGLCRTTIYKWRRKVKDGKGLNALVSRKASGRPRSLTAAQESRVFRWINGRDPRQYGFDFGLWTRQVVGQLIEDKFGVRLSPASVGALLARLGLTPQKPLQRAYERDPEAIEAWQTEVYPKLAARAKKRGAEIYFWDEAGFRANVVQGRTWGKKGETPVIAAPGKRQTISAASAVNARGAFWFATCQGGLNADLFVGMLELLMKRRRRPLFLVLDNLATHKAKVVNQYVASTGGRLELHYLPGYPPELNPDELVWNDMKRTGTARRPLAKGRCCRTTYVFVEESGGENDGQVSASMEADGDSAVGDVDVGGHVDEVAEDLSGLGVVVSAHAAGDEAIEAAGEDEESHVEVDLEADGGGEGVDVEEADGVGEGVLDEHALGVAGDELLGRGGFVVGEKDGWQVVPEVLDEELAEGAVCGAEPSARRRAAFDTCAAAGRG